MATTTDAVLTLIAWVSKKLDYGHLRGVVRVSVQAWWASLLTQEWTHDLLDVLDNLGFTLTAVQATVITFGALWGLVHWIEVQPWVKAHKIPKALLALLMGGAQAPTYKA